MKVIAQRVTHATVRIDGEIAGSIGAGLLLFVGFGRDDNANLLAPMALKLVHLRIFGDADDRFNLSVIDIGGEVLAVPQFTLLADTSKGRRPEFFQALEPGAASQLFDSFLTELQLAGASRVAAGVFGAKMRVELENDGPVTIPLELKA